MCRVLTKGGRHGPDLPLLVFSSADTTPNELEEFLRSVEKVAIAMGLAPATVLNVRFEKPEQRNFSRHLGGSCVLEDDHLIGDLQLRDDEVWHHHAASGIARLIPKRGVVLGVTDEHGRETCFGFMRYPLEIQDASGRPIMQTPFQAKWKFKDFVNSPDQRYRMLVKRFKSAGFLESEDDGFVG